MGLNEVEAVLNFRVDAYNVLRHLYFFGPRPPIIDELVRLFDRVDIDNANPDLVTSFKLLEPLKGLDSVGHEEAIERLQYEFSRLFIGPGSPPVPLFESRYRSPDSLLMQETSIAVRDNYLSSGLISGGASHIPEDHLAVELEYVYYLAGETLKSFQRNDPQTMMGHLEEQRNFLQGRLDWIAEIAARVVANSEDSIITGIVTFTRGIIQEDVEWLRAYIESASASQPAAEVVTRSSPDTGAQQDGEIH